MPRAWGKAGFVKSSLMLRPDQWQWLRQLATEFSVEFGGPPDVSRLIRGMIDEHRKRRQAKKGKVGK